MKKFIILGLLLLVGISVNAQYGRFPAKYHFFNLAAGDTMNIDKDDLVVFAGISIPSNATDSVYVSGDTITIDGFTTSPHVYGAGEYITIGYDDRIRINKLIIAAATKLRLILVRAKD